MILNLLKKLGWRKVEWQPYNSLETLINDVTQVGGRGSRVIDTMYGVEGKTPV